MFIFPVPVFFPILLFLNCLFIFLFKRYLGPQGTFLSSVIILLVCLLMCFIELFVLLVTGSYFFIDLGRWFYCLDLIDSHLLFCGDLLAFICSVLVLSLSILALYFGVEYMYRDAFINRLLYLLNMFATSVILLFFSYDFFLILVAWEMIGLFSLLLVNFYSIRIYTMKAALKTFVFSRISDMFMFFAFILGILVFNTSDLSAIFLQTPFFLFHRFFIGAISIHFLSLFAATLAISGLVKAAQFFFHVWLPDAMEAPTPASALIHSSTLVVAGVFLIIRFSLIYEFTPEVNALIALWGAITIAFGAITATFQTDIKKLVAYSTISQIGYLVCGCGFCCYEEVLVYLIIHAVNKALLFILVGYTVHYFSGNTDMRQMGGIYLYAFDITAIAFGIAINLAGLPYGAGFYAKEFLLFQISRNDTLSFVVRGCWAVSFFFTPLYMLTLINSAFFGAKRAAIPVYKSALSFIYSQFAMLLSHDYRSYRQYSRSRVIRFQNILLNSRISLFMFFSVWVSYWFCGEWLLLITNSFATPIDVVGSPNFFSVQHSPASSISTFSSNTANLLLYMILVLTAWGVIDFAFGGYLFKYGSVWYETVKDLLVGIIFLFFSGIFFFNPQGIFILILAIITIFVWICGSAYMLFIRK